MREIIEKHIQHSIHTKSLFLKEGAGDVERAGLLIVKAFRDGKKLLLAGNGGSAADAQHIAAELVVRYKGGNERRALPAISLAADSSALTACGNDYGYDRVFARQVEGLGNPGDVFLGITTSGNSPNIVLAIEAAREIGMKTILLTGRTGGRLVTEKPDLLDCMIRVPDDVTAAIQETHIMVGHILCSLVEKELFNYL